AARVSNRALWLSLSILPLVILGVDIAMFPTVFERRQLLTALNATTLFENRLVRLGTIYSVSFNVTIESLKDDDSLAYLSQRDRSGLVISVFINPQRPDGKRIFDGELSRAVRLRLQSLSKSAYWQLDEFTQRIGQPQAGDVLGLN